MASIHDFYLYNYPLYRFLISEQEYVSIYFKLFSKTNWFRTMFCSDCGYSVKPTDSFCSNCGHLVQKPDLTANDDANDVQVISPGSFIRSACASSSRPTRNSDQVSISTLPSSSSISNEVRANKAIATKRDRANNKDVLPTSSFGLDPRGRT